MPKRSARRRTDSGFPDRLMSLRESKGWTQWRLGRISGVSRGLISNYETGQRKPTQVNFDALAKALGVTPDHLAFGKHTQLACKDVQLVVLAGGLGSRLAEETQDRPKPMVEIGGSPILWHIVKSYAAHGVQEVIVCLGYLGYQIKEFYANQYLHVSDVTIDLGSGDIRYHDGKRDKIKVTLVDTGRDTQTGGRIKRVAEHIRRDRPFFLTYGDGLSDIDFGAQLAYHQQHGKTATMTCVAPPGRFGAVVMGDDGAVSSFTEKPKGDGGWINGGFFVMSPKALDYIDGDDTILEQEPLRGLAADGELMSWKHDGFWRPMDTLRDKNVLEKAWKKGAPWKNWKD